MATIPKLNAPSRLALAMLALVLFILPMAAPARAADPVSVWKGTITMAQTVHGRSSCTGEVTHAWILNVRWKEGQSIEVKDMQGKVVGRFVRLEDAGSSWHGKSSGGHVCTCMHGGTSSKRESGQDQGMGQVLTPGWGWIFYSTGQDGPLSAVLPNGTYTLLSNPGVSTQQYQADMVSHSCPTSDGRVDVSRRKIPISLAYKIGGFFPFEPFAAPGGANQKSLLLPMVQALASQKLVIPSASPYDEQRRQIKDSRMQGSAENKFHNAISNTISWDITGKLLTITPVKTTR